MRYISNFELFESIINDNDGLVVNYDGINIYWNHTEDHNMIRRISRRAKLDIVSFNTKFVKFLAEVKNETLVKNKTICVYFLKSKFKLLFYVKTLMPLTIIVSTILERDMDTKNIFKTILVNETFLTRSRYIDQEDIIMNLSGNTLEFLKAHYESCYKNDFGLYEPVDMIVDAFVDEEKLSDSEEKDLRGTVKEFTDFMNVIQLNDAERLPFETIWTQFEKEMQL